jgi:hypothetical protein
MRGGVKPFPGGCRTQTHNDDFMLLVERNTTMVWASSCSAPLEWNDGFRKVRLRELF